MVVFLFVLVVALSRDGSFGLAIRFPNCEIRASSFFVCVLIGVSIGVFCYSVARLGLGRHTVWSKSGSVDQSLAWPGAGPAWGRAGPAQVRARAWVRGRPSSLSNLQRKISRKFSRKFSRNLGQRTWMVFDVFTRVPHSTYDSTRDSTCDSTYDSTRDSTCD